MSVKLITDVVGRAWIEDAAARSASPCRILVEQIAAIGEHPAGTVIWLRGGTALKFEAQPDEVWSAISARECEGKR